MPINTLVKCGNCEDSKTIDMANRSGSMDWETFWSYENSKCPKCGQNKVNTIQVSHE